MLTHSEWRDFSENRPDLPSLVAMSRVLGTHRWPLIAARFGIPLPDGRALWRQRWKAREQPAKHHPVNN